MHYYLPTREECLEITKTTEVFYRTEKIINGFKVEMYDYRLASYQDFFPNGIYKGINYSELRGLTFILNPETNEWERNIALQKFFNINQTEGWMEKDFKEQNKYIVSFGDKRDGSLILPIQLPNCEDEIIMKTKMSFISPQAIAAQEIYDENKLGDYKGLIKYCFDEKIQLMFEYTSFDNQIVLNYNNKELTLLQGRYIETGKYLTQDRLIILSKKFNVPLTTQYLTKDYEFLLKYDLDTLKEILTNNNGDLYKFDTLKEMIYFIGEGKFLTNDISNKITMLDFLMFSRDFIEKEEGVVITFNDEQMAKIKHLKYFQMHGLVTEGTRENLLIQTILEDNIDDVLAQILPGEKRDFIENTTNTVITHFNHHIVYILDKIKTYNDDRKEFAKNNKEYIYFGVLMKSISIKDNDNIEKNIEDMLKTDILKKTNGLEKARNWLNDLKGL
jgi:hypothetical protein